MTVAGTLAPIIISLVEDAIDLFNGNDEATIAYLQSVLGASKDNKIRLAIAIEKLKAEKKFSKNLK